MTYNEISRREMLRMTASAAASLTLRPSTALATTAPSSFTSKRPSLQDRKFRSAAVQAYLTNVSTKIGDPELVWLFQNCYPNTLDTTIEFGTFEGKPDTAVITGDIPAMWL